MASCPPAATPTQPPPERRQRQRSCGAYLPRGGATTTACFVHTSLLPRPPAPDPLQPLAPPRRRLDWTSRSPMLSPPLQICRRGLGTGLLRLHCCGADLLARRRRRSCGAAARYCGERPPCIRADTTPARAAAAPTQLWGVPTARLCQHCSGRLRGAAPLPPPYTAGSSPRPAARGCCAGAAAVRTYRRGGATLTPPPLLACCCSNPHPPGAHAAPRRR